MRSALTGCAGKSPQVTVALNFAYCVLRDAVTPNQDWIISPHPKCENLFIATAGSFHSWKFLPTLGSFVVSMLQGRMDHEQLIRWAWDRKDDGAACEMYIPTRDLKDIVGYSAMRVENGNQPTN